MARQGLISFFEVLAAFFQMAKDPAPQNEVFFFVMQPLVFKMTENLSLKSAMDSTR